MSDRFIKISLFPVGLYYTYCVDGARFNFPEFHWDASTDLATTIEMKDAKMHEMRIKYPDGVFAVEVTKMAKEKHSAPREVEIISSVVERPIKNPDPLKMRVECATCPNGMCFRESDRCAKGHPMCDGCFMDYERFGKCCERCTINEERKVKAIRKNEEAALKRKREEEFESCKLENEFLKKKRKEEFEEYKIENEALKEKLERCTDTAIASGKRLKEVEELNRQLERVLEVSRRDIDSMRTELMESSAKNQKIIGVFKTFFNELDGTLRTISKQLE